jgi:hypothetical protein
LKRVGDKSQRWLVEQRGIPAEVLAKFYVNIRGEPSEPQSRNRFGSVFAHRDLSLRLATFVRRGPGGFKTRTKVGADGLFQAGDLIHPERVYVAETAIDALSLFAFDKSPMNAALLATDGSFHEAARNIIVDRAKAWRGPEWHIGRDNDEWPPDSAAVKVAAHGDSYRSEIIAAIREGDEFANIVVRDPGEDYKTWNDRWRGPHFSKTTKAARREAEEMAKLEAERFDKGVGPTASSTPSGPNYRP